jgi:hypothetical protein
MTLYQFAVPNQPVSVPFARTRHFRCFANLRLALG